MNETMYATYDIFKIVPVVRLEVFISTGEIFTIGWGEPRECTQLSVLCHAGKRVFLEMSVTCNV